jgi:protocatechuate 4,5-dioxygenase alpha chain
MILMKAENRERWNAGERADIDAGPMTEEQKEAVLDREYSRPLGLAGKIYRSPEGRRSITNIS